MQLIRGKQPKALKICLYAPEGIGKTTFASKMPRPVFIDTEGGSGFLDVTRTPRPTSWTMLLDQVRYFLDHPSELETLVIDTLDWAERLCIEQFCASKQIKGIEDMPYGRGYVYVAEEFGRLLNMLEELTQKGVHVMMTAHAMLRKFEQPDELGSYDKWELKLTKKVAPLVKEFSDMLLFANYETYIIKETKGAAKGKAQGGRRVMYTAHSPCFDAKNRQGLADKLPFEFEQIAGCFQSAAPPAPAPEVKVTPPAEPAKAQGVPPALDDDTEEPSPAEKAPAAEAPEVKSNVPKALSDLMRDTDITEDEIRAVVAEKGYYPFDTAWTVMDQEGFIDGWIVPFWKNIVEVINSKRAH